MFDKLKDLKSLKESAAGLVETGLEKVRDALREFNDAVPTLKALGLSVTHTSFGLGAVPEIQATFTGSVDALDREKIGQLLAQGQLNKTTSTILEALKTASMLKDELSGLGFRGLRLQLTLGLLPKVEIGLLPQAGTNGAS
jgi:hypothetical protein